MRPFRSQNRYSTERGGRKIASVGSGKRTPTFSDHILQDAAQPRLGSPSNLIFPTSCRWLPRPRTGLKNDRGFCRMEWWWRMRRTKPGGRSRWNAGRMIRSVGLNYCYCRGNRSVSWHYFNAFARVVFRHISQRQCFVVRGLQRPGYQSIILVNTRFHTPCMAKPEKAEARKPTRVQPPRACKQIVPDQPRGQKPESPRHAGHTVKASCRYQVNGANCSNIQQHQKALKKFPAQQRYHRSQRLDKSKRHAPLKQACVSFVDASSVAPSTGKQSRNEGETIKTTPTRIGTRTLGKKICLQTSLPRTEPRKSASAPQVPMATSSRKSEITQDDLSTTSSEESSSEEESSIDLSEISEVVVLEVTNPKKVAKRRKQFPVPRGHKLVHLLRHAYAWSKYKSSCGLANSCPVPLLVGMNETKTSSKFMILV